MEIVANTTSGNEVVIELREGPYMYSCLASGKTRCYFLVKAEVLLGPYQAQIEDRFRLVYAGSHHNWYDEYLIILDPPADEVSALLLIMHDYQILYLDTDFYELHREDIVD